MTKLQKEYKETFENKLDQQTEMIAINIQKYMDKKSKTIIGFVSIVHLISIACILFITKN